MFNHRENQAVGGSPGQAPWSTPEENKAKARRFFDHARKAADTRNYDYAVKLYVDGLALWPDAVEEGLKLLRVVATARKLDGGKPAGFLAARQKPTGGKDPVQNLANALYLYGLDPGNLSHMETIMQAAAKARITLVAAWIAPVLVDAYNSAKKLSESHYATACAAMDFAADLAMAAGQDPVAIDILNANISTAQIWVHHHPDSSEAPRARSNATGKLTIVKGRFDRAEGFQESLKDKEAQREIHDVDRLVRSADRTAQLVARAREEWKKQRDVPAKLLNLVDLMVSHEEEAMENEAVSLLEQEYAATSQYAFKQRADEIRIRQMSRQARALEAAAKAAPQEDARQRELAEFLAKQNQAHIAMLEDRQRHYPTDMRIKAQLGAQLFLARRYDEAIPLLQQGQADGRARAECRLYLGRCFFEKGFHEQAIETLRTTLDELELPNSKTGCEIQYWLGRALEADGAPGEAKKVYGRLIQIDYNFRDARQRLEALVAPDRK